MKKRYVQNKMEKALSLYIKRDTQQSARLHNCCFLCIVGAAYHFQPYKLLNVAQKCFYGEFVSPAAIKRAKVFM